MAEEPPDEILDEIFMSALANWRNGVREWLRANSLAASVHHQSEISRLVRMAGAKAVGIDSVHFDVPFPGTNSSTVINMSSDPSPAPSPVSVPAPVTPVAAGWLSKALLGAALVGGAAGFGGLGLGVASLLHQPPAPATTPTQPPTTPATPAPELIPWISTDGAPSNRRDFPQSRRRANGALPRLSPEDAHRPRAAL